ncbi:hypothetical protein CBS101457_002515 [Exobasidium rhododendri]|nr:hypothetical protein CBS101457_002515 [Exobasidium rhododendri]
MSGGGSSTSRSERPDSYPVYNDATPSMANGADLDYDYDERKLGLAQQPMNQSSAQRVGPLYRSTPPSRSSYSSPTPARSSYSSAPPARSSYSSPPHETQRGNSWDVHSLYSQDHHPLSTTSSPPGYPPLQQSNAYEHHLFPGAFPERESGPVPVNDYYWYAGAPPSNSSSHAYRSPVSFENGSEPGFFGVSAPHHYSGHPRASKPGEVLPDFPPWSRTWYNGDTSTNGRAYTSVPPPPGQGGWESESAPTRSGTTGQYGHVYGQPGMTDFVKEERIRMLEKEFGKVKGSKGQNSNEKYGGDDDDDDGDDVIGEDEDLPLGSVTSKGRLITERPKWRTALRVSIGIITTAGCACGLGGALLVKTTSTSSPAPKGTAPAYILYACSVISLLVLLYLHVLRACCCDPMRKELKAGGDPDSLLGGMIIPVLSGGGSSDGKGKKGKYGKGAMPPTVNLIVDPSLLGMGRRNKDNDDVNDERLPGDARRSKKRKNGFGVMGNIQMQRRWRLARSKVKLFTTWDIILCILWIACDVVSLGLGKKCNVGGGWCAFYNAAIACGVTVVVFLLGAIYFDYRDLKTSRQAPRPPM